MVSSYYRHQCSCATAVASQDINPPSAGIKRNLREEWAISKTQQQHLQSSSGDTKSTRASTIGTNKKEKEPIIGRAGMHCSFAQSLNMRELILLDSDSTDTVFCNPKYVSNIRKSKEPLSISTNRGLMNSHMKWDIPYIDNVWYKEDSITTIISLKDMTNKYRVTMDSKEELALLVHMPDKILKFKQSANGLYAMDPNNQTSFEMRTTKTYQFMSTQEANLRFQESKTCS